jgi:alpha-L-fucosidase
MTRSPLHTRGSATSLRLLLGGFVVVVFWVPGLRGDARSRAAEPPASASARIPESSYDWWREARFGIFIHWNPSSVLQFGEGSWSRKNPTADGHDYHRKGINRMSEKPPAVITDGSYRKYLRQGGVPLEVYDNLFHAFNPREFDADEWAKTFKAAGAGYVVFTAKHHDGFCMFDSRLTTYDIMSTPFGRDIAKELAAACRRQGIELIWYYSRPDWFDPRHDVDAPAPYVDYLTGQITELLTNYGRIAGIWWDSGQIEVPTRPLFDVILRLQPHAISNGRIQSSRHHVPGVSFGTPEQELGAFNMREPWESCVTMMGDSWFWNGGRDIRPPQSCIQLLVQCAIGDGNLLLDFGPDELGRIHPAVKESLAAVGAWLNTYGASVRGTRGGPYMPDTWGGSTRRGTTVYLHITQRWPGGVLRLPSLPRRISGARLLAGGRVAVEQSEEGVTVRVPAAEQQPVDTVVVLDLEGSAMDIPPIPAAGGHWDSLTVNADVTASSAARFWAGMDPGSVVLHTWERGAPAARVTPAGDLPREMRELLDRPRGHLWRTWTAADDDPQPWLVVDLGMPRTFDVICLREKFNRIHGFRIEIDGEGGWRTIHEGKSLDALTIALPDPVTARRLRLVVTESPRDGAEKFQGPGIQEFDVYASRRVDD